MINLTQTLPEKGLMGLKYNWKSDLIAGISVSLVALPLSLGIAIGAGVPPISGIIAAIIGGILTTFFRSSFLGINGPAAGLIVVILAANAALADPDGTSWPYVLAAFVVAGVLQVAIGLMKWGKLGDLLPSSVIHGMLAAIGVIILGKQVHVALGTSSSAQNAFGVLLEIPYSLINQNPLVAIIGMVSICILIIYPKINNKTIQLIPAPMWVLMFSIPLALGLNQLNHYNFPGFNQTFEIGPEYLIDIPDKIIDGFVFPNFSKINLPEFWGAVFSILLVGSLINLISSKAVEKLDPHKRSTDLNKDLSAVGLSTIFSGLIGGLPIITVIVRSSVNVNNGAKTKWSNFFHGLILLIMVVFLTPLLKQLPLAALAAILVFTGFKLASPKVFKETYEKGPEQLVIFSVTLVMALVLGILWGVFFGVITTLIVHYINAKLDLRLFAKYTYKPTIKVTKEKRGKYFINIKGIANFVSILKLKNILEKIPKKNDIVIGFSHAVLVDFTLLEFIYSYAEKWKQNGKNFDIIGLSLHYRTSEHPMSIHLLSKKFKKRNTQLTTRQKDLKLICETYDWEFNPANNWKMFHLNHFEFFKSRPIENGNNFISGYLDDWNMFWEIFDITYDVGALFGRNVYHTTAHLIHLPIEIPAFVMEKEELFDRIMDLSEHEDINFKEYKAFSDHFVLKGPDEKAIRKLFNSSLIKFFDKNKIFHLESNGKTLLLLNRNRFASPIEIIKLHQFGKKLAIKILTSSYLNGESKNENGPIEIPLDFLDSKLRKN
ncbi:SulP family inorganic anion transporter [Flexithrix dorotheae]|uniref:SulP family inorganic anion transporter n=1 Tax=Flexithrix dorotheae TaxID=70993 RepID=UPI00035DEBD8|nr:SulP family inorganic anion transporter [Flexithrix dorotheae]